MQDDRFRDLLSDRSYRKHGCHGFLKYHRDVVAANIADFPAFRIEGRDIDHIHGRVRITALNGFVKQDLTTFDFARRRNQLEQRE
jgi:hypothetical protein